MFHAAGGVFGGLGVDLQDIQQKVLQNMVQMGDLLGQPFAFFGEGDVALVLIVDQPLFDEAFERARNRSALDAEPLGNVFGAGHFPGALERQDDFQVSLDAF